MKDVWKYIIPFIVGIVLGILINVPSCQKVSEPEIIYKEVRDTITIEKERIKWKTKPVEVLKIDTFYIDKTGDTIDLKDLPIEKKTYKDTIKTDSTSTEIQINYSGFNSNIDSIWLKHTYLQKETTIIKQPKKVGFGWYVGVGAGFGGHANVNTGTFGYGPEISLQVGIGLTGRFK